MLMSGGRISNHIDQLEYRRSELKLLSFLRGRNQKPCKRNHDFLAFVIRWPVNGTSFYRETSFFSHASVRLWNSLSDNVFPASICHKQYSHFPPPHCICRIVPLVLPLIKKNRTTLLFTCIKRFAINLIVSIILSFQAKMYLGPLLRFHDG